MSAKNLPLPAEWRSPNPQSRWTILRYLSGTTIRNRLYICRCDCGTEQELLEPYVIGQSLSCGCLLREVVSAVGKTNLSHVRKGGERICLVKREKLPNQTELLDLAGKMMRDGTLRSNLIKTIATRYGCSYTYVYDRLRYAYPKKRFTIT